MVVAHNQAAAGLPAPAGHAWQSLALLGFRWPQPDCDNGSLEERTAWQMLQIQVQVQSQEI